MSGKFCNIQSGSSHTLLADDLLLTEEKNICGITTEFSIIINMCLSFLMLVFFVLPLCVIFI